MFEFNVSKLKNLLPFIDNNTVVIFDIDDTIINSKTHKLIDAKASKFINYLKKQKIPVLFLTARLGLHDPQVISLTEQELKNHNIFSKNQNCFTVQNICHYQNGVIYASYIETSPNKYIPGKGVSLAYLFSYLNIRPSKVIFLDDLEEMVKDVQTTLNQININNICLKAVY